MDQTAVVWWRCPNGHPLGEVRRVNGLSRLLLHTEQGSLRAVITGSADVLCYCGAQRHWQAEAFSTLQDALQPVPFT